MQFARCLQQQQQHPPQPPFGVITELTVAVWDETFVVDWHRIWVALKHNQLFVITLSFWSTSVAKHIVLCFNFCDSCIWPESRGLVCLAFAPDMLLVENVGVGASPFSTSSFV